MQKKGFFILVTIFLASMATSAYSASRTARGLTEAQQLGITAGLALACNAGSKLDDFELIASRIIANQAPTAKTEQEGYRGFAEWKLRAFKEQKESPQLSCGQVLDNFNALPIFSAIVYADGSVKMPDGKMLRPKRPVSKVNPSKAQQKKASVSKENTVKK